MTIFCSKNKTEKMYNNDNTFVRNDGTKDYYFATNVPIKHSKKVGASFLTTFEMGNASKI